MREITLVVAALLAISVGAQSSPALAQAAMADGQVTKIDQSAGKITLKHGPLVSLGMDQGMTMVFRVEDPGLLKGVKVGDKVKFEADKVNGRFTVTKMQKAK